MSLLPYKKSVCLLRNIPEHFMLPVFKKCCKNKSHFHEAHERVEGSAPGHGSRVKLSQVYPQGFCNRLADCFKTLLHKRKALQVSAGHECFIQSLFDRCSVRDMQAIVHHVNSVTQVKREKHPQGCNHYR